MIDRTTSWTEVTPLASVFAKFYVQAFLSTWVSRFDVPAVLTSDRGAKFTSSVWAGVCYSLEISASTTTCFHPQSNRIIEHFHRSLKSALFSCLAGSVWLCHLPVVLLGLKIAPMDETGLSFSKTVYGAPSLFLGSSWGALNYPPLLFFARSRMLTLDLLFLCLTMFAPLRLTTFRLP